MDSPGTVRPLGVILRGLPNLRAGPGFGLALHPTKRRLGEYRVVDQAVGIERSGRLASVTVLERPAVRCWPTASHPSLVRCLLSLKVVTCGRGDAGKESADRALTGGFRGPS